MGCGAGGWVGPSEVTTSAGSMQRCSDIVGLDILKEILEKFAGRDTSLAHTLAARAAVDDGVPSDRLV